LKLDENLPEGLVAEFAALGHDVDNVRMEGLAGRNDEDVWTSTQAARRFLITQDLDFSDIRRFQPGTHHGQSKWHSTWNMSYWERLSRDFKL
jgi:predicted nuclease of predicted toxin-antitoxin system